MSEHEAGTHRESTCTGGTTSAAPLERFNMDVLDMHITSECGNRYIHTFVDSASGFCFLYAKPSKEAQARYETLRDLVLQIGAFKVLVSDRGGENINDLMNGFCKTLGIKQHTTSLQG